MAAPERSSGRNVFIFDHPSDPEETRLLGGLIQNGSITEVNFLDMLGILLVVDAPYSVIRRGDNHIITRLPLGEYEVHSDAYISINNEAWIKRVITWSTSQSESRFCQEVRARDGRCVFSGVVNQGATHNRWFGFAAAHVYPLEAENIWTANNYSRWITHIAPGQSTINSVQNGFLVQGTLHIEWDSYLMSVNPDDNYKIVVFGDNNWGVDGRTLDPICRDPADPRHIPDELLRWHYRQSIFANLRGAEEPIFEHDFPPGSDIVGQIREGPYAKERFEMELARRLSDVLC